MTLSTNNLKTNSPKRKIKRVGRGNASGHGTYSTRGLKGQKARSGSSGLKLRGLKAIALRLPKVRGFHSHKEKSHIINISELDKYFKDGDKITPEILVAKGIIKNPNKKIKILNNGKTTLKNITLESIAKSKSVSL